MITNDEMQIIAHLLAERVRPFKRVMSVSENESNPASRLRTYMAEYATEDSKLLLLVDDVFTSGSTMANECQRLDELRPVVYDNMSIIGAVIFARTQPFDWITALFQVSQPIRSI